MKAITRCRFRYSICGLLGLTTFVAFACFWVTWPRRTAERFVVDCFREIDTRANPVKEGSPEALAFAQNYKPKKRDLLLVAHRRSFVDIVAGRQTFDCETYEFTVSRGAVISGPTPFFESMVRFYR